MSSPNQTSLNFARKLERAKTFFQNFFQLQRLREFNSKIAGKVKIEGDELSIITN